MEEIISLDDLCRLCLSTKGRDGSMLLFNITNSMQSKFEELAQKKVNKELIQRKKIIREDIETISNESLVFKELLFKHLHL